MGTKAATPWGPAELIEELTLAQRAGDKRFASVVQLLEGEKGERAVGFLLVAEHVLPAGLELAEELRVGEIAPLAVLDRDRQLLARGAARREGRIGALDAERHLAADERERRVRAQDAWEQ